MKTLKNNHVLKVIIFLLLTSLLGGCSKSGDNNATPASKSGDFISNSTTYTGTCASIPDVGSGNALGNIDAIIATSSGVSFTIYNIPKQSNGTYNFTDGYTNAGGSSLYALFLQSSSSIYATKSGTVIKTGTNSFTFSCTVYDLNSNQSINVTGKGSY